MTRGEPPAPGTKFRVATARCPQHGGSTGRKGQRAASPLSAETEHTARTLSCRHGKQPGTQPAPTTRQADSRFLSDCPGCPTTAALPSPGSVSSPGFLVFGLTPHRGPAGESCAGRANGQHTGQSSGPQPPTGKHPHASAALTPAQPSVLGAAPRQLGRQHCIHCVGPGSRPWSLWVMGGEAEAHGKDAWQPVVRPSSLRLRFQGTSSWAHPPLGTPSFPRSSHLPCYSALYRHF